MSDPKKQFVGLCVDGPIKGHQIVSTMRRVTVPNFSIPGPGIGQTTYDWHETKGAWTSGIDANSSTDGSA